MKFKYFSIFIFLFLLVCCAGAISAASHDNTMELDQNGDIVSADENDELSIADDSQDEIMSNEADDTSLSATATASNDASGTATNTASNVASVSPYRQFTNDLDDGKSHVYLNGNLDISRPIEIRHNVVIDGQGHTINGQGKTCIFKIYSSTVTINNLIFKNGKAGDGGAIYATAATVNLNGCTFTNNKASNNGGAVYVSFGKLNVDKSTFKNNLAGYNGGAIHVSSVKLAITNSHFNSNKVTSSKSMGHGGAVSTYLGSSSISKTTFKSNSCISKAIKSHKKATKYQFSAGAVYYNLGSTHSLSGCTFTGNKATNHGGAVYANKAKSVKINKCTFKSNKVLYEDGGAITSNSKKTVIKNSKFYNNHAYEDGGVMDSLSPNKNKVHITITGCLFSGNTANKGAGAIWLGVRTVHSMSNNKFINNAAGIGGALFSEAGIATISSCLFQGNRAKMVSPAVTKTKDGSPLKHCGGAMMIQNKNIKLIKCLFKKNRATYGGALFHSGGALKQTANKFVGNVAKSGKNIKRG